jgi:hypothetical protein
MKYPLRSHVIVLCASLLTIPSLQAADLASGGKPEQVTFQNSAQARPIPLAAPGMGILASHSERATPTPDSNTSGSWEYGEIAPSPDILERMKTAGPPADAQSGCIICMSGNAHVSWSGNSGYFTLDMLTNNRSSGTSGTLELGIKLVPTMPVWGSAIGGYWQSAYDVLGTLAAGYYYYNINSGTIAFYNSMIPAGTYYEVMMSLEYAGGTTWNYTDYIVFPQQVTCDGYSGCTTIPTVTTCTTNSTTLCLFSNRFQVKAQYDTYSTSTFAPATATYFSDNTGFFTTVTAGNVDVIVKMVNFCSLNGTWSAYIGGTTDLGVNLTITDTNNGRVYTTSNPLGTGWTLIREVAFSCP